MRKNYFPKLYKIFSNSRPLMQTLKCLKIQNSDAYKIYHYNENSNGYKISSTGTFSSAVVPHPPTRLSMQDSSLNLT